MLALKAEEANGKIFSAQKWRIVDSRMCLYLSSTSFTLEVKK